MNEITHALITYSGIHYLINQEQYNKFLTKGREDEIIIDGCIVKVKNVGDPITIEKYYETYPNKRPPKQNLFNPNEAVKALGIQGLIKQTSDVFALEQMSKGLMKHINGPNYKGTDGPHELLDQINKKIKLIQYETKIG